MSDEIRDLLEDCHTFIDGGCRDLDRRMELCARLYQALRRD